MTFTNLELRKAIEDTLNSGKTEVPDGHKGALVVHVDESGVRTAIAYKTDNNWEVQGTIGWIPENHAKLDFGANVIKTW